MNDAHKRLILVTGATGYIETSNSGITGMSSNRCPSVC